MYLCNGDQCVSHVILKMKMANYVGCIPAAAISNVVMLCLP